MIGALTIFYACLLYSMRAYYILCALTISYARLSYCIGRVYTHKEHKGNMEFIICSPFVPLTLCNQNIDRTEREQTMIKTRTMEQTVNIAGIFMPYPYEKI